MKTMIKQWSGRVKLYHETYDNYQEFYETLMRRQDGAYKKLDYIFATHPSSFIGISSVDEAKRLFLNGWERPLEQLKVQVDKELKTLENKRCSKTITSVCGYMPIIPNALMGLPNSMLDTKKIKVKSKVLRFVMCLSRQGGASVDEIIRKTSKQLAYIAMLERSGQYRCRIEVAYQGFGGLYENGRDYSVSCSILVKSENQLFDVKRLCYPVINPSMQRLLMWGWCDSLPMNHDTYGVSGYGCSFNNWSDTSKKAYIDAINENNENVICVDLDTDIEKVLKKGGC